MEKVNFNNIDFIKSAPDLKNFLFDKESILFLGKSNVGKSSLINKIFNRKNFMRVSQTPGRTRMLNYALVDDTFYMIDAPGYGYFKKIDDFESMMLSFIKNNNKTCKLAMLLVDSRRLISEDDKSVAELLAKYEIPFIYVYTKSDKLKQQDLHKVKVEIEQNMLNAILVSAETSKNIDKLREIIISYL